MYELPRRETELVIEIQDGQVKLVMEPLTEEQYFRLNETGDLQGEGEAVTVVYRFSRLPGLFAQQLRRVEGVQVDGQPFDVGNPAHLERIPHTWKAIALGRVARAALSLTDTERGNSPRPAPPSTPAETPSQG